MNTKISIAELSSQLRDNSLSAEDLADQCVARAEESQDKLNAFTCILGEEATTEARIIDTERAQGKKMHELAGIPCAIKDLICTKGIPTTAASTILAGFVPPYDAEVVARIRKSGSVIIGKTNMDEFAMGSSNEFSSHGNVKNPIDTDRVPGGSSGGSAAAVAAGIVPYALGTDTGGSVRQPASFCGVVGFKPTYGRVSRYGVIAYASSFDQVGSITTTVEDAALVYETIAGNDTKDATTIQNNVDPVRTLISEGVKGMRIGLPKEFFYDGVDSNVADSIRSVGEQLTKEGAIVEECTIPLSDSALAVYLILSRAEASANLSRYDGVRYGNREEENNLEAMYTSTRTNGFGAEIKRRILLGTFVLSSGYADRYYRKAAALRQHISNQYVHMFKKYDAILMPTAPETAFRIGEKTDDPLRMYMSDILTVQANVAGLPALSVPAGDFAGLPIGAQVMAPRMREDICFRVGAAIEKTVPSH